MINAEQHKKYFGWLGDAGWSMYSTCFPLAALKVSKQLMAETHPFDVPYVLDDGNSYRLEVERVHKYLVEELEPKIPVGELDFGDDSTCRQLQAADVVAWTVRRKRSGDGFRDHLEPLESILTKNHVDQRFEEKWMADVSDAIRLQQPKRN